jgi:hypothetical protein
MNENTRLILSLYDGKRSSRDVANMIGVTSRYVRKVAKRHNLDRLPVGARGGVWNHQFVSGRRIDFDGYAVVTAPEGHPSARNTGSVFEHRLILEQKLSRYLLPEEATDHIDGLTLHNDPSNLRLFQKNGDHLRATITGIPKQVSVSGKENIRTRYRRDANWIPVDIYHQRRIRGDVRLRQMILAALKLGIDSPYLLGTHRHFEKAGIDPYSHSNLKHAWDELSQRWEEDLAL